jgi:vacuolar-type H+-ATPase subunit H
MLPESAYMLMFTTLLLVEALVVVLLIAVYRIMGKYDRLHQENERLRTEAELKADDVFAKAQKEAQKLLDDAREKAHKIIAEAEGFSKEGTKKLQESLEWMLQDQTRTYTEQLQKAREQTEKQLMSLSSEVNQMAATELKVFANNLQKQTAEAQADAQKSIEEAYKHMGDEVEKYRVARMQRVDELVKDLVLVVARDVMGKSLTNSDHESLVEAAVAEAKKRKVL